MSLYRPNPSQVTLQLTAHNIDGTPKLALASAKVRVYHMSGATEVEDLALTDLTQVPTTNTWRYAWTPGALPVAIYFAEYVLVDNDGADFVDFETLVVMDVAEGVTLDGVSDMVSDMSEINMTALYEGKIHFNSLDGITGTEPPTGSAGVPVSDEDDAQELADNFGFREYRLHFGAFYMTQHHDRWYFEGVSNAHVKLDSSYSVNESRFRNLQISGQPSGNNAAYVDACILWPDLAGLYGFFDKCIIAETLYLGAGDSVFQNCTCRPSPYCTIDCQGNTVRLHVNGFYGEIHLKNFGPGSYADFDFASGKLTLESTCTGGIVEVRGEVEFIDNTTEPSKPIIVDRAAVNQRDRIEADVDYLREMKAGTWEIDNNQMIYEDTTGTEIARFDLFDINGNPTNGINMYKREPAGGP